MTLADQNATVELGARIARGLRAGDVVLLSGELGAGKTALARAILRALGVNEHVPSPTFTLMQTYDTPKLTVRHLDLYRVEDARELDELGLDEALDDGAVLVEWPERAAGRWPDDAMRVGLTTTGETSRRAVLKGPARWREALANA
jgi:tRNA threonylcarbamoyladenosine biosynthesis protein TsaE